MSPLRKILLTLLGGALCVGFTATEAQAKAPRGFITNRQAAYKVGRMPYVYKAHAIGRTKRFVKVSSWETNAKAPGQVRVRYVNKRTKAIASTSRDLAPRAKQLAALMLGREGAKGFRVVAGDATGNGLPLLTHSGRHLRVGATGTFGKAGTGEVTARNFLADITSGRVGKLRPVGK